MPIHLQSGDAITASYQLKTSNFEGVARSSYAVDTSGGSINITLPANPVEGDAILFADARKTWATHPPVFLRNGNKIEGAAADYTNSSQGTFFTAVYLDSAMGWRILESDTKPQNLALPTVVGEPMIGVALTTNPGSWTGAPTAYTYQWQISSNGGNTWSNISGATNSTYTPISADEGKCVRVSIVATNANGSSPTVYSAACTTIGVSPFPLGAVAFWKMEDNTDSSGNGKTLTNTNNTQFVSGKIGNCADFTGSNRLSSNQVDWQLSSGDATASIWMNLPTRYSQKSMVGFYQGGGFAIDLLPGNGISISNAASAIDSAITWVGDNVWGHLVIVKTGTTVKMYRNSVLVKTVTTSSGYFNRNTMGITLYIGDCTPPGFPGPAQGKVDAFGLWNRALSEAEVAALYNGGNGLQP